MIWMCTMANIPPNEKGKFVKRNVKETEVLVCSKCGKKVKENNRVYMKCQGCGGRLIIKKRVIR